MWGIERLWLQGAWTTWSMFPLRVKISMKTLAIIACNGCWWLLLPSLVGKLPIHCLYMGWLREIVKARYSENHCFVSMFCAAVTKHSNNHKQKQISSVKKWNIWFVETLMKPQLVHVVPQFGSFNNVWFRIQTIMKLPTNSWFVSPSTSVLCRMAETKALDLDKSPVRWPRLFLGFLLPDVCNKNHAPQQKKRW